MLQVDLTSFLGREAAERVTARGRFVSKKEFFESLLSPIQWNPVLRTPLYNGQLIYLL